MIGPSRQMSGLEALETLEVFGDEFPCKKEGAPKEEDTCEVEYETKEEEAPKEEGAPFVEVASWEEGG